MGCRRLSVFPAIVILSMAAFRPEFGQEASWPRGQVIPRVECQRTPDQSYALYLPRNFSSERKWPILFAFDPGGRGPIPVERFRTAAEGCGYIIAASNNARNGPWEPIISAVRAVFIDAAERFPLDGERIYAAGFSGGARVASIFGPVTGRPPAGIIACGAGLSQGIAPGQVHPSAYLGLVGDEDFNLLEMKSLDRRLDSESVIHLMRVFSGRHQWPPAEECSRAVEWMEVEAMKRGIRPRDDGLVESLYAADFDRAQALEISGDVFAAAGAYEDLASHYSGLRDTAAAEERAQSLKRTKEFVRSADEEKNRDARETASINRFLGILENIRQTLAGPRDLAPLLDQLGIASWLKEFQKAGPEDKKLAFRVLHLLSVESAQRGNADYEKKDYPKAELFFEIAQRAAEFHPEYRRYVLFNLAACYARNKKDKKTVQALRQAVDIGFDSIEALETEEAFDSIRRRPEFLKILESLKRQEPPL